MSKKNDGGPVYPQCGPLDDEPGWIRGGMSLRDWFAGQALLAIVSKSPFESAPIDEGLEEDREIARGAFAYADAMLAERDKEATHD